MKTIAIMTTGGDCSGLNSVIRNLATQGLRRGHRILGILDGTDGLTQDFAPNFVEFDYNTLPPEEANMAGSWLRNGNRHALNFETAKKTGLYEKFTTRMRKSLKAMNLDALVVIGGNGSLSIAAKSQSVYGNLQLIGIPKTIDMDIPATDTTIGFDTAVNGLSTFCNQLMLTGRSHHRWFVVQAMGREVGALALHAGIATGADAILIPEIKFDVGNLCRHIENIQKEQGRDYGIIIVAEGIKLRGHSGQPADMISRELTKRNINNRTAFPEHTQRTGDTIATDRILAARFATAALDAIDNNETYVMTSLDGSTVKTVPISEMINRGAAKPDPNIPNMFIANAFVPDDHPLLSVAVSMGAYIGEIKKTGINNSTR
ncbi:MAG: ATP-dependent 6-phosphofructokinase [Alphaproteobacteria bacterium]|nr:ATP-dependent 6-phosphofructokinase [Alphaproteobacteria bacterium]